MNEIFHLLLEDTTDPDKSKRKCSASIVTWHEKPDAQLVGTHTVLSARTSGGWSSLIRPILKSFTAHGNCLFYYCSVYKIVKLTVRVALRS